MISPWIYTFQGEKVNCGANWSLIANLYPCIYLPLSDVYLTNTTVRNSGLASCLLNCCGRERGFNLPPVHQIPKLLLLLPTCSLLIQEPSNSQKLKHISCFFGCQKDQLSMLIRKIFCLIILCNKANWHYTKSQCNDYLEIWQLDVKTNCGSIMLTKGGGNEWEQGRLEKGLCCRIQGLRYKI